MKRSHPSRKRAASHGATAPAPALGRYRAGIKGLDSRLLRQFLAVVECKSFTLAAQALHVTQPALTKSIQKLEQRLDVKLLERRRNGVEPTRYGQVLASRAKLVELEIAHAVSEIQSLRGGHQGIVNVGSAFALINHLPRAILAMQRRQPNVAVRVSVDVMDPLLASLLAGDLDIACSPIEFPSYADLETEPLMEHEHVLVARREHPLAGSARIEPRQLVAFPWITFARGHMASSKIGSVFAANRLPPPNAAITVSSVEIMFAALRHSDYVAALPDTLAGNAIAGGLVVLPFQAPFWRVRLYLAYRRSTHPTAAMTSMLECLRSLGSEALT
ncbi:MAG: LysR family transcriptional regulator [Burkholderiales bacterium]|nr:LysR family transcriptional regulator [Burkholderiales bacterium]